MALRARAEQGDAEAQYGLGFAYSVGFGVPQDAAEKMRWYRLAAEQGYAAAQYELGLGYKLGERVPQDAVEAARLYRLAAEQGYASAQYGLGSAYYSGDGQRHRVSSQNLEPQSTDLSRTRLLTA